MKSLTNFSNFGILVTSSRRFLHLHILTQFAIVVKITVCAIERFNDLLCMGKTMFNIFLRTRIMASPALIIVPINIHVNSLFRWVVLNLANYLRKGWWLIFYFEIRFLLIWEGEISLRFLIALIHIYNFDLWFSRLSLGISLLLFFMLHHISRSFISVFLSAKWSILFLWLPFIDVYKYLLSRLLHWFLLNLHLCCESP